MILNRQRKVRIAKGPLQQFLTKVLEESRAARQELTVCMVTDAEMARWNRKYRRKSGPTDVLSFPADARRTQRGKRSRGALQRRSYLGDVAIAPAAARRCAKKNGRTLDEELRVLILHGVLHLLGYDHESDNGEMERLERRLRRRLGLTP